MKHFVLEGSYVITVRMEINAEDLEQATDIADGLDTCIDAEWNGNSVFVNSTPDEVTDMTLDTDGGLIYNIVCLEETDIDGEEGED